MRDAYGRLPIGHEYWTLRITTNGTEPHAFVWVKRRITSHAQGKAAITGAMSRRELDAQLDCKWYPIPFELWMKCWFAVGRIEIT